MGGEEEKDWGNGQCEASDKIYEKFRGEVKQKLEKELSKRSKK